MASRNHIINLDLAMNNDTSSPDGGFVRVKAKPDNNLYLVLPNGTEIPITGNTSQTFYVPTLAVEDYSVAANRQVLFTHPIDFDNYALSVDGIMIEV